MTTAGPPLVKDELGEKVQKLFQDFLEEYQEDGISKYLPEAKELAKPERNTLLVDFSDVEKFNPRLKEAISDQCYRLYPYLCNAAKNFVKDNQNPQSTPSGSATSESNQGAQVPANKEFYVAFENVSHSYK
jgi:DNA replication licensing factor MCM6